MGEVPVNAAGERRGRGGKTSARPAGSPQLANIGSRCQRPIGNAIRRGGFMTTEEAKIIDNAIMGYMQQQRLGEDGPDPSLST